MNYPKEFTIQAKARVETARIQFRNDFVAAKTAAKTDHRINLKLATITYFQNVFFAFAKEACAIAKAGKWSVDHLDNEVNEAVDPIARDVFAECFHLGWINDWMFSQHLVSNELWSKLKDSGTWSMYQEMRLEVAYLQATQPEPQPMRPSLVKKAAESLESAFKRKESKPVEVHSEVRSVEVVDLPLDSQSILRRNIRIHKLKSLLGSLEDQDLLLSEPLKADPYYKASESQGSAIKGVIDEVLSNIPELTTSYQFDTQPNALRAHIRPIRESLLHEIYLLERDLGVSSKNQATEEPLSHPKTKGAKRALTRFPRTITSPIAARRMETHMASVGLGLTEFATQVGITDRTLRTFRRTGKVDRQTLDQIAAAMGITRERLMAPEPN